MATNELFQLRAKKDWMACEEYILKELSNDPTNPDLWSFLSESYACTNRFPEAQTCASKAIAFDPLKYQGWFFLANAYTGSGNWDGVEMAAKRSMELAPDLPQAHWILGHCAMVKGLWGEAWAHLEYGTLCDRRKKRAIGSKAWTGQPIKGKTLFVWGEQGAGDVIQYARFLPLLKKKTGARIVFECRPGLVGALSPLADMTIAEQQDLISTFGFDYHVGVMDIPMVLGLDTKDIVGAPYLEAEPRPDTQGKIGLVWRGYEGHGNDVNRSIPFDLLDSFKDIENLVVIQPGVECPEWMETIQVSDFASTATALIGLDCLISVDTATAHLAGALGVPTILIAPMKRTEARWAGGDKTVWYDSWQIVHAQTFEEGISRAKELLKARGGV